MANRLKEKYVNEVTPSLIEKFEYSSIMQAPKIEKIVLNMGVGDAVSNSKNLDEAVAELELIAGQKPVITRAKKSIAGFRLREGMAIGTKVTLRGERMYDFLDKLINVSLPRVRDFRGVSPKAFDGRGNYTLGIREQLIFPEIDYDQVNRVRGLDIVVVTTANTDEEARELLTQLGMPASKIKKDIAEILKNEGFVRDVEYIEDDKQGVIRVFLKYGTDKTRVITGLKRISKPGLRSYVKADAVPKVLNGLGIAIISTSEGVITDKEARAKKIGGEVLAYVW